MSKTAHLTPAYGRDYKNKTDLTHDLRMDKDFIFHDPVSLWDGSYANKTDLKKQGYTHAQLSYANMRKVTVVEL